MMKTENKIKNLLLWLMQFLAGLVISALSTMASLWILLRVLEISFSNRTLVLIGGLVAVLACFTELGLVAVRLFLNKMGLFKRVEVHVYHLAILIALGWICEFNEAFLESAANRGLSAGRLEGFLLATCLILPVVILSVLQSRFAARHPMPYRDYGVEILEEEYDEDADVEEWL